MVLYLLFTSFFFVLDQAERRLKVGVRAMAMPPTFRYPTVGQILAEACFCRADSKSLADTQDVDEGLQRRSRSKMISTCCLPVKAVSSQECWNGRTLSANILFAASGPFAPRNFKKAGVWKHSGQLGGGEEGGLGLPTCRYFA